MTTAHICMLVGEAHEGHPIIRRQVKTLLEADAELTVLQREPTHGTIGHLAYCVRYVQPVSLGRLGKLVWRPLQRIWPRLGTPWWTLIHVLEVVLGAIPLALAAYRVRATCYQAHDLYSVLPALIAGRIKRARVVYDAHELTSEQGDPRALRNAFERCLERWLVPRVDALIVPSELRGRVYVERCALNTAPIVVLNCPPFSCPERSKRLHARLGLPGNTRVVLYHGSLMPGRALENLVESAGAYEPGILLVIIGAQGEYYREVLSPLANSSGLRDRVRFVPYVAPDEIMSYVASADVGVVIYRNINLNNYLCAPTKLYEYLMAGVPVVASNFPDLVAFVEEYPVGRTFDPESPDSIARAVNQMVRLRSNCDESLAAAIEVCRHTFNWERESRKLLPVLGVPPPRR